MNEEVWQMALPPARFFFPLAFYPYSMEKTLARLLVLRTMGGKAIRTHWAAATGLRVSKDAVSLDASITLLSCDCD